MSSFQALHTNRIRNSSGMNICKSTFSMASRGSPVHPICFFAVLCFHESERESFAFSITIVRGTYVRRPLTDLSKISKTSHSVVFTEFALAEHSVHSGSTNTQLFVAISVVCCTSNIGDLEPRQGHLSSNCSKDQSLKSLQVALYNATIEIFVPTGLQYHERLFL